MNKLSMMVAILLLWPTSAAAQMGSICSVVAGEHWAVSYDETGSRDVCQEATLDLNRRMFGDAYPIRYPAFDVYFQSYFLLQGENQVFLTCDHADFPYLNEPHIGVGAAPILDAIRAGRNMATHYKGCRVHTEADANVRHPIADRSMQAYCFYQTEQGNATFVVSGPGYGRTTACADARTTVSDRDARYKSSGYFLAAGETRILFDCPTIPYNSAYVYGEQDMIRLAHFLNDQNVTQCAVTTDIFGDYGYGAFELVDAPSFGRADSEFVPPTPTSVVLSVADDADALADALQGLSSTAIQDVVDRPEFVVDPQTGEASLSMPSAVSDQIDLANQGRRPTPRTEPGPGHTDRRSDNQWNFGNQHFGVSFGYVVDSQNFQQPSAQTYAHAVVLGRSEQLFGGNANMSYSAAGESVSLSVFTAITVLDDTIELLDSTYTQPTGRTLPGRPLFSAELFRYGQQFMVGPVPVYVTVSAAGDVGYSSYQFGWQRTATGNEHHLHVSIVPTGNIKAIGTGGVGVAAANAGAMGEVYLVKGELYGNTRAIAHLSDQGWRYRGCVQAGVTDLSWLSGQMSAYYAVQEPTTAYIEEVIGGGCRIVESSVGGFFGRMISEQICEPLDRRIREVTRWTRILHKKSFYRWAGKQALGNHSWYNTCGM